MQQSPYPVYLTNGLCEDTGHWTTSQFETLGLGYQTNTPWGTYPLTKEEEQYVRADDGVELTSGDWIYFGYSALYQEQKYLAPALEMDYAPEGETPPALLTLAKERQQKLTEVFAPLSGFVRLDEDSLDYRVTLDLFVPLHEVMGRFPDWESWFRFCQEQTKDL